MIPNISSHRNENPLGPSPKASAVIALMSDHVHRYPDMHAGDLVRQIAHTHKVREDDVVLGNGSAALLQLLIDTTCLSDSDDEVLFFTPEFVLYRYLAKMRCLKFTAVGAKRSTQFDVRQLIAAANSNTRICLVSNPHNPTGIYFNRENILTLINELPQHILLVIDEAYAEFATAQDFPNAISLRHLRENMVVVRTFSKAYGLAGLRIGYLIGNPNMTSMLRQQTLPYQINALAEVAAIAALKDKNHLERTVATNAQERQYMHTKLKALGVHVWESQGNFLFVEMGHNTEMFYHALAERNIDVSYIPEVPGLRVTINTRQQNQLFLDTLADLLEKLPTGTLETDVAIRCLIDVGKFIDQGEHFRAQQMLEQIQQIPGLETDVNGRLALAFAEGLDLRISQQESHRDNLYCKNDMIRAFQVLLKQTPLVRQGHLASLVAIVGAASTAQKIHIVDIGIGQGTQWTELFEMLDANTTRCVHLTGIDLPVENDAPQQRIGEPLAEIARRVGIQFKYSHIAQRFETIDMREIDIQPDEMTAVSAAFALHHLSNRGKRILVDQIAQLNPHIITIIEPDSEHDSLPFLPRLREAIGHYGTVFDVLNALLPNAPEREIIEDAFFKKEIVDVIGAPDVSRYERHHRDYYWQSGLFNRLMRPVDMSRYLAKVTKRLGAIHPDFEIKQRGNTFRLCWKHFPLVASSAWTCRAST